MPDPIFNKLGAYLDGELNSREAAAVEAHLKVCVECRAELEELRRLSSILEGSPDPEFMPVQEFKSRLMLQLPRREDLPPTETNIPFLLWLAPFMVIIVLVFIQVTIGLTSFITTASQFGLFNGSATWMAAAPRQMAWFTAIQTLGGISSNISDIPALQFLNNAGVFSWNLFTRLLLQIAAAVIYWGILIYIHRRGNALFTAK